MYHIRKFEKGLPESPVRIFPVSRRMLTLFRSTGFTR
jgi:hypothetical protein